MPFANFQSCGIVVSREKKIKYDNDVVQSSDEDDSN